MIAHIFSCSLFNPIAFSELFIDLFLFIMTAYFCAVCLKKVPSYLNCAAECHKMFDGFLVQFRVQFFAVMKSCTKQSIFKSVQPISSLLIA